MSKKSEKDDVFALIDFEIEKAKEVVRNSLRFSDRQNARRKITLLEEIKDALA